jgi:4-amino-4-deoxy-L-arabinose transferase-like glycosyltransferase
MTPIATPASTASPLRAVTDAMTSPTAQRWAPWWVFLFGLAVLLPAIWSETSVTGSDEYSLGLRTPMEMKERGQWLTPWVNEEPRLRKPPLVYWLILSTYQLAGVSLMAARIWGVLAGAGLGLVACLIARELFRSNGLLAGLLTVSCLGVAAQARQAMLDLPLAVWVSLAVWCGLRWWRTGRVGWCLLAGAALGLSFLTKGPVGLFFFGAALVAALIRPPFEGARQRHAWHWLLALTVFVAVSVPWPLAMQRIWSDRFTQIVGEELAARNFGRWHGMAPLSALGGALGLIVPWTPMVMAAVFLHFQQPRWDRLPANAWLITAFLFSILPFFFMATFERYMLAVVPLQAVLAAEWLTPGGRLQRLTLVVAAVLFAVLGLAISLFAFWFRLSVWMPLLTGALAVVIVQGARRGSNPLGVVALSSVLLALVFGGLYPRLGLNHLPAGIETVIGDRTVLAFDRLQPAMLSPRLGRSVQPLRIERIPADRPALVFVDRSQRADLESQLQAAGLSGRELTRFKTFYSRKAWVRFARADASAADWRDALARRSLDGLRTEMIGIEVQRSPPP